MVNNNGLEKLRLCGRLETYSTARHQLGFYNNVSLTATYNSPGSPSTSIETVTFAALKKVIAKHTNLSAIPLNEDKSYPDVYFARLPTIDLHSCVEFHARKLPVPKDGEADEELDRLLTEQHSRGFKGNVGSKPFWRLAVLTATNDENTFTAAWMWHHALADGASAFLFHETFLSALNSLASEPDADPIVKSPDTPLPPPFEKMHPMGLSWSFFLKAVAAAFLPSVFNKRPATLWTGNSIQKEATPIPHFNFRTFVLSADTTKRLAKLSRKEKSSVTATLQTLLAATLFANLPATQFNKVRIVGPMAMRPFLPDILDDQMTNAITQYEFLHQRSASSSSSEDQERASALQYFSWNEARTIKSTIESKTAKKGQDNNMALLKYVSNMHELFTGDLGKPRVNTAEVSNIGVYRLKANSSESGSAIGNGEWTIGRMTFSQCPNPTSCAFGVNVVTGGDGNASVNFCWCAGAVEDTLVGKVVEGLREGVEKLVQRLEE